MAQAIVIPAASRQTHFELRVSVNTGDLRFEPVLGRRTFYANITLGRRTFWLQRWDTERCSGLSPFALSSDRLMCWTAGSRSQA